MAIPFISEKTALYSPFNFLMNPNNKACLEEFANDLENDLLHGSIECFIANEDIHIYIRKLAWDTEFFGIPTFRIEYTALPKNIQYHSVQLAFSNLRKHISTLYEDYYLFAEIPSEDTAVIAGIGSAGWRLIETRITCFRDNLQKFDYPSRSAVRKATEVDIPELRFTAIEAVNYYDRFHADDFFTRKESDEFMAIFVENSVKGLADEVIVPKNGAANAFLTANFLTSPLPLTQGRIGKMVLSAVSPERKGWYVRLIAEMSYIFKEQGLDTAFMSTQATNRAVLKVWFRHGYRFGRCTHIFSTYVRTKAAS